MFVFVQQCDRRGRAKYCSTSNIDRVVSLTLPQRRFHRVTVPLTWSVSFPLLLLQVKYKKDFEESKGRGFSIVSDTPEMQRLRRTQEQISNVWTHTPIHTKLLFVALYMRVCVCMCEDALWSVSTVSYAHTQTQNVYIIKPCSVLTSAVWRGASSTTISVSDHDFYLVNVGKVGYIMNVSERQQKKKKKKGFWERTEAKGSVKGQRRRTIIHE